MSTINYTYNVIVDRFRQFAAGHFQLRRFTHGEISQADLEKEAEWPWLHVKPRAINYAPGTRSFSFEIFISDLPRDKEDKTGYQAESITDCSLIFQDLINEIYLGNMFGDQVVLSRPVNSEPFVEQYTHTLTGVTGTIELNLDYDWSACSIPASWNYNTPTDSPSDGWGALQFIESLDQNGVFVSLDGDVEAPGNSYYYGTNASGVKGWYATEAGGLTCEDLPECATIISILEDIASLQTDVALKANTADLGAVAFSNDYNDLDNKPTIPDVSGFVPYTGATQDVNLGEFGVQLGNLEFDVTPTNIPTSQGSVYWDDNAETLALIMNGTTQKVGEDTFYHVRNTTGSTIPKGSAVRFAGTTGNSGRLLIAPMIANGTTPSQYYMGVTSEEILNNQDGKVYQFGKMRGVNTSSFADGDILYVSTTVAGGFQTTQPTAPNNIIVAAAVVHSANNGTLMIRPTLGSNINADEGVLITTPANNDVLTYESSTSLWKNKAFSTGLTVGTTPITSGAVGRVLFEGTGNVLQESANLFWDNTNNRLGIGTATPATSLDVRGNVAIPYGNRIQFNGENFYDYAGLSFAGIVTINANNNNYIRFNGNNVERMRLFNNGNFGIGTTTDAGYKLDVNGSTRVQGNAQFGLAGATTTSFRFYAGTSAGVQGNVTISGLGVNGVFLGLGGGVNATSGNNLGICRAFLNEMSAVAYGFVGLDNTVPMTFRFGAYGSSVEALRLTNTQVTAAQRLVVSASTTTRSSMNIPSGTAPTSPVNGDIWFDGTDIKMQIGGVTKTFTLT